MGFGYHLLNNGADPVAHRYSINLGGYHHQKVWSYKEMKYLFTYIL
jgi:hypothetical protein